VFALLLMIDSKDVFGVCFVAGLVF
jgi:hypothetical protein